MRGKFKKRKLGRESDAYGNGVRMSVRLTIVILPMLALLASCSKNTPSTPNEAGKSVSSHSDDLSSEKPSITLIRGNEEMFVRELTKREKDYLLALLGKKNEIITESVSDKPRLLFAINLDGREYLSNGWSFWPRGKSKIHADGLSHVFGVKRQIFDFDEDAKRVVFLSE